MDIFSKAIEAHKKGQILVAEKLYLKILKENPDHSEAIYYLGHIELSRKKIDKALSYFKKATEINPYKEIYWKNFLNIFITLGNPDEAILISKKILKKFPNSYQINFLLALALYKKNDLKEAITHFKKTTVIKPDYYQVYNNLGVALLNLNEVKEAEENFRKAISLKPDFINAHNNLALVLKALHKQDESEFHFQKAIQLNPEFKDISYEIKNGNWEQSKEKLEKFIVKNTIDTKRIMDIYIFSWCNFCIEEINNKKFESFVKIFINLLKIEKKNKNIDILSDYFFSKYELNKILKFLRKDHQLLVYVSYGQFKFLKKEYDEAEEIASSNIKKTKELIVNKETEDLGWLILKRSMLMFQNKLIGRDNLNKLISRLDISK